MSAGQIVGNSIDKMDDIIYNMRVPIGNYGLEGGPYTLTVVVNIAEEGQEHEYLDTRTDNFRGASWCFGGYHDRAWCPINSGGIPSRWQESS